MLWLSKVQCQLQRWVDRERSCSDPQSAFDNDADTSLFSDGKARNEVEVKIANRRRVGLSNGNNGKLCSRRKGIP